MDIKDYLENINRILPISIDEEVALAKRAKNDEEAKKKLIDYNHQLVTLIAMQYKNKCLCMDELVNAGNEGLLKAVQKYDETLGYEFIPFTIWWIRKSILKAINGSDENLQSDTPENVVASKNEEVTINMVLNEPYLTVLRNYFGIDCTSKTIEEIANQYNLTKEQVRQSVQDSIRELRKNGVDINELM